jgi:histidinol-phosphate/aromatic aminotransferase/cobyric acid decarboxylase-like protein
VLDAWYDPAPGVVAAIRDHLPWLLRTSPPTHAEGLVAAIAETRGVPVDCVVPGAGSSDLIYRVLPRWLSADSRVLLLEPTYGEYGRLCEDLIGCHVDRLLLRMERNYDVDPAALGNAMRAGYDLVVLVNPNNPTGRHLPRAALTPLLEDAPEDTRVWIDEAYIDYAGPNESLEAFACRSKNVVVCKSMSKVYALSGCRVGYLCCNAETAADVRAATPPWVAGLVAQVAATHALRDPAYYEERRLRTHELRARLATSLIELCFTVVAGAINSVLCFLPKHGPTAAQLTCEARRRGLFIREFGASSSLGEHAVRITVKDADTNERIVRIVSAILRGTDRADSRFSLRGE